MAYILYLHPVAPKSSLSVPYQWFLVIDQCNACESILQFWEGIM